MLKQKLPRRTRGRGRIIKKKESEMTLKESPDFYHIDPGASSLEQLVQFRNQSEYLIKHYQDEIWNIDNEILAHMHTIGGTSLYGPELPDGTPSFVVEQKETGGTYDRWQFRAMAEIFTAKEYEECYVPESEETKIIPESWLTVKVKKFATKHGREALEIFNKARIPGKLGIKIVWMKEGGEVDEGRE
jgi:hypothetical protein